MQLLFIGVLFASGGAVAVNKLVFNIDNYSGSHELYVSDGTGECVVRPGASECISIKPSTSWSNDMIKTGSITFFVKGIFGIRYSEVSLKFEEDYEDDTVHVWTVQDGSIVSSKLMDLESEAIAQRDTKDYIFSVFVQQNGVLSIRYTETFS